MEKLQDDSIHMLFHPLMDVDEEHVEDSSILIRDNIKVLTYNIFIRPPPIKNNESDYKSQRLDEFLKILNNFDIICLQEMFGSLSSRRHKLIESAYKSGLFYQVEVPSPSFFSKNMIDAGLVILSRFPILESEFRPFKYTVLSCSIVEKGILYAKIQIKDSFLIIFTTHVQASYFNQNDEIHDICVKTRRCHIEETAEYIYEILNERDIRDEDTVLLMGDFNVDANGFIKKKELLGKEYYRKYKTLKEEYNMLMKKLNEKFVTNDLWLKKFERHQFTYGMTGDIYGKQYDMVLTDKNDHGNVQTLDYIFEINKNIKDYSMSPNVNKNLQIEYNSMRVEEFFIENKPFQQLSDHFGVSIELSYKEKNSAQLFQFIN